LPPRHVATYDVVEISNMSRIYPLNNKTKHWSRNNSKASMFCWSKVKRGSQEGHKVARRSQGHAVVRRSRGHKVARSRGHEVTRGSREGPKVTRSRGHEVTRSRGHEFARARGHERVARRSQGHKVARARGHKRVARRSEKVTWKFLLSEKNRNPFHFSTRHTIDHNQFKF